MLRIDYESYIPIGSKIVGKSIGEVESNFRELKIDHLHNSPVDIDSQVASDPKIVLKPGMSIKIKNANPKVLAKFCKDYDLP